MSLHFYPRVSRSRGTRRGFVLATVLILTSVIALYLVSMLTSVTFEKRMARRTAAVAELKLTSDALLNYVGSQVTNNPMLLMRAPFGLKLPPTGKDSFYKGGSDSLSLTLAGDTFREVIATPLTPIYNTTVGDPYAPKFRIDGDFPFNERDKLVGQSVERDICILAVKASVRDPLNSGKPITEYTAMVLERRGVPLFNYLAFFDVAPFRISNPGSMIVLDGPIQSNQGIIFESQSSSQNVRIENSLHTSGKFEFKGSTAAGKFMIGNGKLNSKGSQVFVDMLKPKTSVLYQSSDGSAFTDFARDVTNGRLRSIDSGESPVVLNGLNYVDDAMVPVLDANGYPTYDNKGVAIMKANPARSDFWIANNRRIDPPNPALRNDVSDDFVQAQTAEMAKTAYQARLYVYAERNGEITVFTNQADAEAYKGVTTDTARAAWKVNNASKVVSPSLVDGFIKTPSVVRYYNDPVNPKTSSYVDMPNGAIFDGQQKATVAMIDIDVGALNAALNTGGLTMANGSVWNARDELGWNGVLYVDVQNPDSRPMAPVQDKTTGFYLNATTGLPDSNANASNALRAQVPTMNVTGTARSWDANTLIDDSVGLTGVRIKNAKAVPAAMTGEPGFTLATNTATYSVGSINADGDLRTGSTSLQDGQAGLTDPAMSSDPKKLAISAAIFSDKHVVLSDDFANSSYDYALYVPRPNMIRTGSGTWRDPYVYTLPAGITRELYDNWPFTGSPASGGGYSLGGKSSNDHYFYQQSPLSRTGGARVMELAVGFMIGDDVASNKGIHTMLSFLQSFDSTNDVMRVRGAILGIYKARYFKGAAGSYNDYYVAPQRNYGYSSIFRGGKMPPSSPTSSAYRRMRQFKISKEDFDYLKDATSKGLSAAGISTDPGATPRDVSRKVSEPILKAWVDRLSDK